MPDAGLPLSLVGAGGAYALGLERRWANGARTGWGEPAAFFTGLAVLAFALLSPLDGVAHRTLWVHMVQHVLLVSLAAPLLVLGHPIAVARDAWPRPLPALPRPGIWPLVVAVAAVQVFTLLIWHVPALYDAALRSNAVHAFEHLSLLLTAVALWAALEALEGEQAGLAVVALFLVSFPPLFLGGAMTFARTVWYRPYGAGVRALTDQQLAGVVMWGYGGLAAVVGGVYLFVRWLRALEGLHPGRPASTISVGPMP
jgi:putative membrane protein